MSNHSSTEKMLEDSNTTQYESSCHMPQNEELRNEDDSQLQDEIRNEEQQHHEEDDDDAVIDEEFLQRYPREMQSVDNISLSMASYIPETPEPPDPETTDVSIGHDDEDGLQYVPASLGMSDANNNLNDADVLGEINEPFELDQEPAEFDDSGVGLHDFSVPMRYTDEMGTVSLNERVRDHRHREVDTIILLDDTQPDDALLEDDDILAIDKEFKPDAHHIDNECIDLTLDDEEDNQERQAQLNEHDLILIDDDIQINGDDMFADVGGNELEQLDHEEYPNLYERHGKSHHRHKHRTHVEPILLSDDDKENIHAVEKQRESPMGWKRKRKKSRSPDLFDGAQTDILNDVDEELEKEFDVDVDIALLSQEDNLRVDVQDLVPDDDELFSQEIGPFTEEDELNIDTLPMDLVLRHPVSAKHSSPKKGGRKYGFGQRRKRPLELQPVREDSGGLTHDDYF